MFYGGSTYGSTAYAAKPRTVSGASLLVIGLRLYLVPREDRTYYICCC